MYKLKNIITFINPHQVPCMVRAQELYDDKTCTTTAKPSQTFRQMSVYITQGILRYKLIENSCSSDISHLAAFQVHISDSTYRVK